MKELKCPKCGTAIQVDDSDYFAIVEQVRNSEFDNEVNSRVTEMKRAQEAENRIALFQAKKIYDEELTLREQQLLEKNNEVKNLTQKIASIEEHKELEFNNRLTDKEKEIAELRTAILMAENKHQLDVLQEQKNSSAALNEKEKEINNLKMKMTQEKVDYTTKLAEAQQEKKNAVMAKEKEIQDLQISAKEQQAQALIRESGLKQQYEIQLKQKEEEVQLYKDMRVRLSTKMLGESLEQHCAVEFNRMRVSMFPNAYFEKDNDITGGTKGDFIFRDYDTDGTEYLSIMFEMKNEMDTTATKHKNEDFLAKLDRDRRDKKCEYAVLVSLLEIDSEFYNQGIVDMSYRYEKMYVIRPQFFMTFIMLLSQANRKTLEYRRQLAEARERDFEWTSFENQILDFSSSIGRNLKLVGDKREQLNKMLDKIIDACNKAKELNNGLFNNLRIADDKIEAFSLQKLLKDKPSLRAAYQKDKEKFSVEDITEQHLISSSFKTEEVNSAGNDETELPTNFEV